MQLSLVFHQTAPGLARLGWEPRQGQERERDLRWAARQWSQLTGVRHRDTAPSQDNCDSDLNTIIAKSFCGRVTSIVILLLFITCEIQDHESFNKPRVQKSLKVKQVLQPHLNNWLWSSFIHPRILSEIHIFSISQIFSPSFVTLILLINQLDHAFYVTSKLRKSSFKWRESLMTLNALIVH